MPSVRRVGSTGAGAQPGPTVKDPARGRAPGRYRTGPRGAFPDGEPAPSQLVRHQIVGRPKELLGRIGLQAGHAAHVDVRIEIDLQPEARHLALLLEQRAPVRVEALRDAIGERLVLGHVGAELGAYAIEGALHAYALGLPEAVVGRHLGELLEASLVVAQIVLEA